MKAAIILDSQLGPGLLANASACITSGLFHNEIELYGDEIPGDGFTFIPITKIPILVLRYNGTKWAELLQLVKKRKLKYMIFTKEGQTTTSYSEYASRVNGKSVEQLQVIGIGVLGEDEAVKSVAGSFPLLR